MGVQQPKPDGVKSSKVLDRLTKLRTLFATWAETGVPPGVKYPKSLNTARDWTNAEYGIDEGIGSKRDISKQHPIYGKAIEQLDDLIKQLSPAKVAPKRVYKTAKARTVAAQDERDQYKARLEGVTKQLMENDYEMGRLSQQLGQERQKLRALRDENDELRDTVGRLTRDLALSGGGLKVVS